MLSRWKPMKWPITLSSKMVRWTPRMHSVKMLFSAKRKKKNPLPNRIQRQAEEEEPAAKRIQRQAEEEEPAAKRIQRQAEEEEPAAKRIQRQAEEEEPAAKRIQRQAEEEEPAAKRIQRQAEEEEPAAKRIQRQAEEEEPAAKRIQRQAEKEEPAAKRIQRQAEEEEPAAKRDSSDKKENQMSDANKMESIEAMIQETKGQGMPLPESIRKDLETKMEADFSNVRIHLGPMAIKLSAMLSAQAFTHGYDIYFNVGKYDPHSQEGSAFIGT